MFRCYSYTIIRECINSCLAQINGLPDDGVKWDETCRSCFNVNFNIVFQDNSLVYQLVNK